MIPKRAGTLLVVTVLALLSTSTHAAHAQTSQRSVTIEYKLTVSRPVSHLYDIQMDIRGIRDTSIDVAMPAWAPGDYRIRDFARNVQEFSAQSTRDVKLTWNQIDKQTWRIRKSSDDDVQIHYRLYSNDLTDEMADISGPATFMYVVGNTRVPVSVKFEVPSNWNVYGSLEKNADRFTATDYDALADSPTFLGNLKVLDFSSKAGIAYSVVFSNPKIELTERQVIEDLHDIADSAITVLGPAPHKSYTFLVKVRGATGTEISEHLGSSRITVGENDFVAQAGYRRFVSGATRALVRSWIGKKIHPQSLDPIDYSKESYTRLLWFMDGAASYYADILEVRSGFLIPDELYGKWGSDINALQHQAGRQLSSLEEVSLNAWTRGDNTAINTFSYPAKDEIAALMLDLEIRGRTKNQKSLNDVVRSLMTTYGDKGIGVPEEGVQKAATTVSGVDLAPFFDNVIRGRNELDYNASLQYAGLEVSFHSIESAIYLGVEWERAENSQVRIRRVMPNSPAERAQMDAGDILLALDSERITSDNMLNRVHSKRIGTPVTVTLMRGERMLTAQITPGETKEDSVSFGENQKATPEQIQLRKSWLGQ